MAQCRLSAAGRFSVHVGLAVLSMNMAHAQNIVSAGQATVGQHNGVDVVNIVAPNASGLSLNQFKQYNVGTQGAVLNNSTAAGQSQLAGQLGANAQLRGQAASVILNQVVGNNPSLLLGKQEVFGMAADYVLANPNGITCAGCGFINTPRASLVVGTPELANGQISSFVVGAHGGSNALTVSGGVSGATVLDLIAPKVDINGMIQARDSVNIIAGRQRVDYAGLGLHDLTAEEQKANQTAPVLDGSVIGSIAAGTIRIHASDPQGNTRIQADLEASKAVDVNVAGNLSVQGQVQSTDVASTPGSSYSWWDGVTHRTSGSSHTETFTAAQLHGDDVSLTAGGAVNLNAVKIDAQNVHVTGDSVDLGNTVTTSSRTSTDGRSKFLWNNTTTQEAQVQTLYGNAWQVGQNVDVRATHGAVNVEAATIVAGGSVAIDGAKGVTLEGAATQSGAVGTNRYANETAALKTGKKVVSDMQQTYHATSIQAGQDSSVSSAGNVNLLGAKIDAGQVTITSQGATTIGTQTSQNVKAQEEDFVYWGGIGGGETHNTQTTATLQNGSSVHARNITVNGDGGVNVTGSSLTGSGDLTLASANGNVSIGHGFNHLETLQNDRHGTAFNIADKSRTAQSEADTTLASTVSAQGNVRVSSAKDIQLTGSSLTAGQALDVHAAGVVRSDIADAQTSSTTQDFTLGGTPNFQHSASGADLQVTLGVGLQGVTHTVSNTSGQVTAATLTASTVTLQGDEAIALKGSQITAKAGDVKLTGKNVTLAAGDSKASSSEDDTNVTSAGVYVSATLTHVDTSNIIGTLSNLGNIGIGKINAGAQVGTQQTNVRNETHQAVGSRVSATGNVAMQADQTLQNTGTVISTPGEIALTARDVVTDAAAGVSTNQVVKGSGAATLTASAAGLSAAGFAPPVAIALGLNGQGVGTTTVNSTAVASSLSGGKIVVTGRNSVTDSGTQYAATGDVSIHAPTYVGKAAENTQVTTIHSGNAGVNVDMTTATFQDLNVQAGANGAYAYQQTGKAQAVLGSIKGQNVDIQADNTISSAMNIAAADRVSLSAGQDVTIAQADNRQWQTQGGFNVGGSLGLTVIPATGVVTPSSFGVNAGVNYLGSQDSQAVAAGVSGQRVSVTAGQSAVAQGANVKAGDFSMQADKVIVDAAYDHHAAFGINADGNVAANLAPAGNGSTALHGGGLGGNVAVVSENASQGHGGSIVAENVSLIGNSKFDDLRMVGTNVDANTLTLANQSGNVSVMAVASDTHKGNWSVGGNVKAALGDKSSVNVGADGRVAIDVENSTAYQSGQLNVKNVSVTAGQDVALQTGLKADALNVKAGGNVSVSSAQNRTSTFQLELGASAQDAVVPTDKTTASDFIKAVGSDVQKGGLAALKPSANVKLTFDDSVKTQVNTVHAGSINVNAGGGQVNVSGANVSGDGGSFGTAAVTTTSNHDYVHHVDFSGSVSAIPSVPAGGQPANGSPFPWPVSESHHVTWTDSEVNASVTVK